MTMLPFVQNEHKLFTFDDKVFINFGGLYGSMGKVRERAGTQAGGERASRAVKAMIDSDCGRETAGPYLGGKQE